MIKVESWLVPILMTLTVAGLALAADRRTWWAGALVVIASAVLMPIPPLRKPIGAVVESSGYIGALALYSTQIVLEIGLAARVARRALPADHDHTRAARGFGLAIVAVVLRALFAAAMIAWAVAGAERFVVGALMICGLDALALAALIRGTWLVAQAHHESLPRYVVHIALACALATLFGLANVVLDWYSVFHGPALYAIVPAWWIELGGTLTLGWMFVALGRYARRQRQIAAPVVLCAGAFTLFACVGVAMRNHEIVTAVCLLLANLAAVPAFRAARNAIVADPVKTTADVFA